MKEKFTERLTKLITEYGGTWKYLEQTTKLIRVEVTLPDDKHVIFDIKKGQKG